MSNYEKKYGECWECQRCRTTHPWTQTEKTDGRAFCSPKKGSLRAITLHSFSCKQFKLRSEEQLTIVRNWMLVREL